MKLITQTLLVCLVVHASCTPPTVTTDNRAQKVMPLAVGNSWTFTNQTGYTFILHVDRHTNPSGRDSVYLDTATTKVTWNVTGACTVNNVKAFMVQAIPGDSFVLSNENGRVIRFACSDLDWRGTAATLKSSAQPDTMMDFHVDSVVYAPHKITHYNDSLLTKEYDWATAPTTLPGKGESIQEYIVFAPDTGITLLRHFSAVLQWRADTTTETTVINHNSQNLVSFQLKK